MFDYINIWQNHAINAILYYVWQFSDFPYVIFNQKKVRPRMGFNINIGNMTNNYRICDPVEKRPREWSAWQRRSGRGGPTNRVHYN